LFSPIRRFSTLKLSALTAMLTANRSRRPVRVRTPEVADVARYPAAAKLSWKRMKAAREVRSDAMVNRARRAFRGCTSTDDKAPVCKVECKLKPHSTLAGYCINGKDCLYKQTQTLQPTLQSARHTPPLNNPLTTLKHVGACILTSNFPSTF